MKKLREKQKMIEWFDKDFNQRIHMHGSSILAKLRQEYEAIKEDVLETSFDLYKRWKSDIEKETSIEKIVGLIIKYKKQIKSLNQFEKKEKFIIIFLPSQNLRRQYLKSRCIIYLKIW